ncbi:GDP-mannose 4,6-dehydratase [Alsobacter soli]|uniref:GDP-mannose 4,6-dehydratase n=1 Tax=Alsobacter soli TaxID=2109933 RepID=A0A2T1HZ38_9HYPH|nr:GDP-mannose 4,6-dehydratase [Alsobacter soli]PSC06749.1 GDP-mannose 4,6-dehydratase [Alsobacter soli]
MKRAVITGVTGQDGAYLTALLLEKGYRVHGTYRRSSTPNFWRLEDLGVREHPNLTLSCCDVTDLGSLARLIDTAEPDELYNLGAQTYVAASFEQPIATAMMTGMGPLNLLEAVRIVNPKIRVYQASSAEMFGKVQTVPQNEKTPFYPRSPYGVAKVFAHWMGINYRESYGMFVASGILFNHESPLRGLEFVTRRISDGVARIAHGSKKPLTLGNLDAKRDWGYAKDYVEGMWRMLQADEPDSFVLATNRTETVRDFAALAFKRAGIPIVWTGQGEDEKGVSAIDGSELVSINPEFYRPAEVSLLIGDPAKAREVLGWRQTTTLEELCALMVDADMARVARERHAAHEPLGQPAGHAWLAERAVAAPRL